MNTYTATKITIAYLVVGFIWIIAGDSIVEVFVETKHLSQTSIFYINIAKGLAYVLLTGLGLYLYTRSTISKLASLEKQYRGLFEDNPNPMWVYDVETLAFLAVNKAALKCYGYTHNEFLSLTLRDIRPVEEIPVLEQQIAFHNDEISNSGTFKHKRKSGEVFYANIYSATASFGKRKSRMVLAVDVHEKILAEQKIKQLNNELIAFKDRLDEILLNVNDIVWACSADDFKVTFISSSSERVYGYTPQEFYDDPSLWFSLIHPDDNVNVQEEFKQLLEAGNSESEYRIVNRQGETKVMYDKSVVKYDSDGKPKEIHGVATDITQLRESEQKFTEYAQSVTKILDGITDGFVTVDKQWRFTYANKVFQQITQLKKDDLMGKTIWEMYPVLLNTPFQTNLTKAAEENISVSFESQYPGAKNWYLCTAYPNPNGLAIYFADVTHTHLMREEISRTKNNLNALINNTEDIIWSVNTSFELMAVNDAYKDFITNLLGKNADVGEKAVFEHLPDNRPFAWKSYYERAFKGESFLIDDMYELPETGPVYYEVNFNPIYNENNEIIGAGCFAKEITQRKKNELFIAEQNKQLLEIAWMQSHEVRGPLSTLMGLVALFNKQDPAGADNIKILQMMEITAKKLDEVVQRIVTKANNVRSINDKAIEQHGV
ncbi:MAG: PAS domain S-box protein [Bacteroidetes bacterium]|nr:MAG: PAS domain S-box protein [Bacteroidota bacterium]